MGTINPAVRQQDCQQNPQQENLQSHQLEKTKFPLKETPLGFLCVAKIDFEDMDTTNAMSASAFEKSIEDLTQLPRRLFAHIASLEARLEDEKRKCKEVQRERDDGKQRLEDDKVTTQHMLRTEIRNSKEIEAIKLQLQDSEVSKELAIEQAKDIEAEMKGDRRLYNQSFAEINEHMADAAMKFFATEEAQKMAKLQAMAETVSSKQNADKANTKCKNALEQLKKAESELEQLKVMLGGKSDGLNTSNTITHNLGRYEASKDITRLETSQVRILQGELAVRKSWEISTKEEMQELGVKKDQLIIKNKSVEEEVENIREELEAQEISTQEIALIKEQLSKEVNDLRKEKESVIVKNGSLNRKITTATTSIANDHVVMNNLTEEHKEAIAIL